MDDEYELCRLQDDGCPNVPEHFYWREPETLVEYMMRLRRELFLAVLGGRAWTT